MTQKSLRLLMTSTALIAGPIACGGDATNAQHSDGSGGGSNGTAQTTTTGGAADATASTTGAGNHTSAQTSIDAGTSTLGDTSVGGSHLLTNGGASAQSGGSTGFTRGGADFGGTSANIGGASGNTGGTSGNTGGTSGNAGATNSAERISCGAPACCAPLLLEASRVDVYRLQDVLIVNLVVQPSDPNAIDSLWKPYADISTSWGGEQTCTVDRRFGKNVTYVTLTCPPVPSTQVDCGTFASIQVRLRVDTFAGVQPFELECQGTTSERSTTLTVPIECPVCPTSSSFFGYQPCDYPEAPVGTDIAQCSIFSQPCHCLPSGAEGSKLWSCPQP